ncbi:MAG TPA: ABC transporter permease, partial [Firmicutes bacterium]|nr:ABC transporter permease [Bacillota bacterium]
MTETSTVINGPVRKAAPARTVRVDSPLRQVVRRFRRNRLAVIGLAMLALLCLMALLAPWIAPYKPTDIDLFSVTQPPGKGHLLGTDELGRDVLS